MRSSATSKAPKASSTWGWVKGANHAIAARREGGARRNPRGDAPPTARSEPASPREKAASTPALRRSSVTNLIRCSSVRVPELLAPKASAGETPCLDPLLDRRLDFELRRVSAERGRFSSRAHPLDESDRCAPPTPSLFRALSPGN